MVALENSILRLEVNRWVQSDWLGDCRVGRLRLRIINRTHRSLGHELKKSLPEHLTVGRILVGFRAIFLPVTQF